MRCLVCFLYLMLVLVGDAWSAQPFGIRLNPNGVSYIYPVFDSKDWVLTQPDYNRIRVIPDRFRVTHFGDEYYAQDWARGCGKTFGLRVYAGISGKIIFAGDRGPFGNTMVIYDQESGFALKYSHLSEIYVNAGEFVLAGRSLLGRVGNTGNIKSSGCQDNPGSHLHLALFKNITDPNARPITLTYTASGSGPTHFAADFEYTPSVDLVRTGSDPTVYASYYGSLVPVTAASFESHGWGFDAYNRLINPVRVESNLPLAASKANYFWPFRENTLLKFDLQNTVYVLEEDRKYALDYQTFSCRAYRFGEVSTVSSSERDSYLPMQDSLAQGCVPSLKLALNDFRAFASTNTAFHYPDWSGYMIYPDWDPVWELRWLRFWHASGKLVDVYRLSSKLSQSQRYIGYWEPVSGLWTGWQRIY